MKGDSCSAFSARISLYVEDDLDARAADEVRKHITACAACASELRDYRLSQAWLRQYEAPAPDAAALDSLRRHLARRLEPADRQPPVLRLLQRHWWWQRRTAPGPTLALVALALVSTAAFLGSAGPGRKSEPSESSPNAQNFMPEARVPSPVGVSATPESAERESLVSPDTQALGDKLAGSLAVDDSALDEDIPSPDNTRIEIQTRDPKVRIIWFAQRQPTQTSEN